VADAKSPDWKETMNASDSYTFTSPVGSFVPNALKLYDMHGNVWQWCQDWYDEEYYAVSPVDDPTGPDCGCAPVLRGGSWYNRSVNARSAGRNRFGLDHRDCNTGFRVARTP
jgi:formylglycine-generating enzyme required for sulfatase activity